LVRIFLFFFQAEDGIRDFHVTGVQTCALPIFLLIIVLFLSINRVGPHTVDVSLKAGQISHKWLHCCSPLSIYRIDESSLGWLWRSEERRVGKECGCRWSAYPCNERGCTGAGER